MATYIASTLLVILWLSYTIYVTLKENEEDAAGGQHPARISEILKVCSALCFMYIQGRTGPECPEAAYVL